MRTNTNTEVEPFAAQTRAALNQVNDLIKMQTNHASLQMTGIGQPAKIEYEEYEVQPGDTIMSVAFKNKINQRLLRKLNNFLIEDLVVGETIMIPIMPEEEKGIVERRFSQFTIKMNTNTSEEKKNEEDQAHGDPKDGK